MKEVPNTTGDFDVLVPILDFIARILEAVSWPIAMAVIVFLLRSEIKGIAGNLKKLKWGDAEAIFEDIAEAKDVAKTLDPIEGEIANENTEQTYTLLQQAAVSPTGAIIVAYKEVEELLRGLYEQATQSPAFADDKIFRGGGYPLKVAPVAVISRGLERIGWISNAEAKMLEKLRQTRNRAAHSNTQDVSIDAAKDFVLLADKVGDILRSKQRELADR